MAGVKFGHRAADLAFKLPKDGPVMTHAGRAVGSPGPEPILLFSSGGLDAHWFDKQGVPTMTIGAGKNETHTSNEYVDLPALANGRRLAAAMATLVVIDYESEVRAEEVRLSLLKMQKEYLVDLIDAVIVVRDAKGKVKLRQLYDLTLPGAIHGGFWGALVGLLFLNPLFGFALGAAAGAISGRCATWGSTTSS